MRLQSRPGDARASLGEIGASRSSKAVDAALLLVAIALALRCQIINFRSGFWQDEFETMVVSKMMAAGLTLYSGIFNQHGPLIFAFGDALDSVVDASIADYRIVVAIMQWLMIGALMLWAEATPSRPRLVGLAVVLTLMLGLLPFIFGQMFMYQTVAGIFTAVALAMLVLPVLRGEPTISGARAIGGGFLLGCLPFLAFTYAAASAGLILCALTRTNWRAVASGVALAIGLNAAFILAFCSPVGFVADHLYLNLVIYPAFGNGVRFEWVTARKAVLLAFVVALALVVGTAVHLVARRGAPRWKAVVLVLALASFLSRGPGFQAVPFYYAMLPLILAMSPLLPSTGAAARVASLGVILLCLVKLSLLLPWDVRNLERSRIPTRTAFSDLVQRYTKPTDRIVSYSFDNFEYIASHRLPAVADFYFLPQQAAYETHPVLGLFSDPCADIRARRPKFVKLGKELMWHKFTWDSYGTCVDDIMRDDYAHLGGTPIYIRKDIWPSVKKAGIAPAAPSGLRGPA